MLTRENYASEENKCTLPSGICLSGTEWWYWQSLRCHHQFLQSYCRSLRCFHNPWGDRRPPMRRCRSLCDSLNIRNIVKHSKTSWNTCKTLLHHKPWTTSRTSWNTLKTTWNIMKHLSFDATISALDEKMSALGTAIGRRSFDVMISPLDAVTSVIDAETSAIARSYWWYRRGVFGDIGDCGVGVTPQMCNRVTNHEDMGTFSRPVHPFCCYSSSENINCHSIQAKRKKYVNNIKRALDFYY